MNVETWPRWLPSDNLRDRETHWVKERGGKSVCGASTMCAEPGHPTTKRRRCASCVEIAGPAASRA